MGRQVTCITRWYRVAIALDDEGGVGPVRSGRVRSGHRGSGSPDLGTSLNTVWFTRQTMNRRIGTSGLLVTDGTGLFQTAGERYQPYAIVGIELVGCGIRPMPRGNGETT